MNGRKYWMSPENAFGFSWPYYNCFSCVPWLNFTSEKTEGRWNRKNEILSFLYIPYQRTNHTTNFHTRWMVIFFPLYMYSRPVMIITIVIVISSCTNEGLCKCVCMSNELLHFGPIISYDLKEETRRVCNGLSLLSSKKSFELNSLSLVQMILPRLDKTFRYEWIPCVHNITFNGYMMTIIHTESETKFECV